MASAVSTASSAPGSLTSSTSTSFTCSAPASLVVGNLLVAFAFVANTSAPTFGVPTGWAQIGSRIGSASNSGYMAAFRRVVDGTEGSTFTFPLSSASAVAWYPGAVIVQLSGIDHASAIDQVASQLTTTASTSRIAAGVTPTSANELLLCCYGSWDAITQTTAPSGMALRVSAVNAGNETIYLYDQTLASKSATGTRTATASSADRGCAFTVSIFGVTSVTVSRSTTWTTCTAITVMRNTTWTTYARITPTRITTWTTNATIISSRLTTWASLAILSSTRATSWATLAVVSPSRSTSWVTLASITLSRNTKWMTAAGVVLSRSTTWNTFTPVNSTRSTTWDVNVSLAQVVSSRATTWITFANLEVERNTSWQTLSSVSALRLTSWNVFKTLTALRLTSWDVFKNVSLSRQASWADLAIASSTRSTAWVIRALVGNGVSTQWNTLERKSVEKETSWNTFAFVQILGIAIWDVLLEVIESRETSWYTAAATPADYVILNLDNEWANVTRMFLTDEGDWVVTSVTGDL